MYKTYDGEEVNPTKSDVLEKGLNLLDGLAIEDVNIILNLGLTAEQIEDMNGIGNGWFSTGDEGQAKQLREYSSDFELFED